MTKYIFIYNIFTHWFFKKENIMRTLLVSFFLLISLSGCVVVTTPVRRGYEEPHIVVHRPVVVQREVVVYPRPSRIERRVIIEKPRSHQRRPHHHHQHWNVDALKKTKLLWSFSIYLLFPSYIFYMLLPRVD